MELSEEMVNQKLSACRLVYESEFEFLARQFEEIKRENEEYTRKWNNVQELVAKQETQILHLNNMIENAGNDL